MVCMTLRWRKPDSNSESRSEKAFHAEPMVCTTLRWREMDSNHQYLEDKRRFVQRLRLCRVFDESLATARFFTPLGIIARNLSGR